MRIRKEREEGNLFFFAPFADSILPMNLDPIILQFFNQTIANPILDAVMLTLTIAALGIYLGIGVALWVSPHRKLGQALVIAFLISFIWTMLFQYAVMRPRPEDVRLIWPTPNFPSYPSGHSAMAFAFAVTICLTDESRWLKGGSVITAVLVALSRVYLGHHYPSDILGGAILGGSVGAASYGLIMTRTHSWRWLFWPQMALILLATQMAYLDVLPGWLLRWYGADKVLHFILFGGMAFWLNIWLEHRQVKVYGWSLPLAILLVTAYALGDEAMQGFSSVRTVDLGDLVSGLSGVLICGGLSQWEVVKR